MLKTFEKKKKILPNSFYVSTGTCTAAIPLKKNDHILADFGILGKVEFIINWTIYKFIDYLKECNKIRINNGQNIFIVYLIFILRIINLN